VAAQTWASDERGPWLAIGKERQSGKYAPRAAASAQKNSVGSLVLVTTAQAPRRYISLIIDGLLIIVSTTTDVCGNFQRSCSISLDARNCSVRLAPSNR